MEVTLSLLDREKAIMRPSGAMAGSKSSWSGGGRVSRTLVPSSGEIRNRPTGSFSASRHGATSHFPSGVQVSIAALLVRGKETSAILRSVPPVAGTMKMPASPLHAGLLRKAIEVPVGDHAGLRLERGLLVICSIEVDPIART